MNFPAFFCLRIPATTSNSIASSSSVGCVLSLSLLRISSYSVASRENHLRSLRKVNIIDHISCKSSKTVCDIADIQFHANCRIFLIKLAAQYIPLFLIVINNGKFLYITGSKDMNAITAGRQFRIGIVPFKEFL